MSRIPNLKTLLRITLLVAVACAAMGGVPADTDSVAFAERLTTDLYLRPLHIDRPSLRIEVDRFNQGSEPHAFIVHVYRTGAASAAEVLTVNIVRVRAYLQYVSAAGPALKSAASKEIRDDRHVIAVNTLHELGGYETDGKERHSVRAGFVEQQFTHPAPPSYLSNTATAVFNKETGFLVMFGTPAVPPGE